MLTAIHSYQNLDFLKTDFPLEEAAQKNRPKKSSLVRSALVQEDEGGRKSIATYFNQSTEKSTPRHISDNLIV
jgi:hypothetical protein